MAYQFINLYLLALLFVQIHLISLTSVLNKNVVHFQNISEAYLSFEAEKLYILNKDPDKGNAQLNLYSINNGDLANQRSLPSQSDFSMYWQIYDFQTEIFSFPIKINQVIDIYNTVTKNFTNMTQNHIFFRGIWSRSQQKAYFSTVSGGIGYGTLNQMQKGEFDLMEHSKHTGNTYLSLSPNQRYVCSTDMNTGLVSIWDCTNKALSQEIQLNQSGILTHSWSADSQFLYVFGKISGNTYQLNSQNKFGIVTNYSTSIPYIISSFYNYESGEIIALAANQSFLFVIDFNLMNVTKIILNFTPTKMRVDLSKRYITLLSNNYISVNKIESLCNQTQYYNFTTRTCMNCKKGCAKCDGFSCFQCMPSYKFNKKKDSCTTVTKKTTPVSQITQSITTSVFAMINQTINVPGNRQYLNIIFQLFSNFDHFLLYIYHNRTFGTNMQNILQQIHDTIDYRFQFLDEDVLKKYLGLDFNLMQQRIDYKFEYSFEKYTQYQSCGQGFFESNIDYFFLNIPLIVVTMVLYRIIYKMFSHFRLSALLKRFTHSGLIILLLLQGNTQFFFFSFVGDFLMLFSKFFYQKWFNTATIATAFIFLMISTYGGVYLYLFYRKKASQFYENCKIGSSTTVFYFFLVFGILNILRGVIHRTTITIPDIQAFLLFLLQFSEALLMLIYWKRLEIFQSTLVTLLILTGSVSRSLFNLSLLMSSLITLTLLDYIHIALFWINILTFFISIIHNIYELVVTIRRLLSNKIKNQQNILTSTRKTNNMMKDNAQKTDIGTIQSSEMVAQIVGRSNFKRQVSMNGKGITFKFCKKNVKNMLTIKEPSNKKFQNDRIRSVDLK